MRKPSGLLGRVAVSRFLNTANVAMNRQALSLLELEPNDCVLEVGFGGGDLLKRMLAGMEVGRVVGVDFSPDMVEACRRRHLLPIQHGRLDLYCADASALPLESNQFTKACSVNTLYFWEDPAVPLRELQRVLRPHGRLVLGFSLPTTLERVPYTKYGFGHHEPDAVQRLVHDAGFVDSQLHFGRSRVGEFVCLTARKSTAVV